MSCNLYLCSRFLPIFYSAAAKHFYYMNDALGRRFLFLINKIENNTLHIQQLIDSNDNSTNDFLDQSVGVASNNATNIDKYDPSGAAKYIVVVVLVYGFGIIFFIASQVRSSDKLLDEVDGVNAEKILRSMETELFTKDVLVKLSDPQHRERAWKIYLSDKEKPLEPDKSDVEGDKSTTSEMAKSYEVGDDNELYERPSKASLSSRRITVIQNEKEMVVNIEKKLKLLQKVQEEYKKKIEPGETVETVKEVLKPTKHSNKLLKPVIQSMMSGTSPVANACLAAQCSDGGRGALCVDDEEESVWTNSRSGDHREAACYNPKVICSRKTDDIKSEMYQVRQGLGTKLPTKSQSEIKPKRKRDLLNKHKQTAPPLLKLETDYEGLARLNQSRQRSAQSRNHSRGSNRMPTSRSSEAYRLNGCGDNDDGDLESHTTTSSKSNSMVSFDICEISEKITSV